MTYLTWQYYVLLILTIIIYYLLPLSARWAALLAGSICFYALFMGRRAEAAVFVCTILISWFFGRMLEKRRRRKTPDQVPSWGEGIILAAAILICVTPLLMIKICSFLRGYTAYTFSGLIVPIGISFYSLQVTAYLADVHAGKVKALDNPLHYALFISFFPQIVQGPIPRLCQLSDQLIPGNRLKYDNMKIGFYQILEGAFLKYMIADKAAVYVNEVFSNYRIYTGAYVAVAAVLYSIQLYTDFLACVMISKGSARMFGIMLPENFMQPYLAVSIKDFWRRWHISLSTFLRDYVYIPLGGGRKGKLRRYVNLMITFAVSGFWHGEGIHFILWGLLNGLYQIAGDLTSGIRGKIYSLLGIPQNSPAWKLYKRINTFILVTLAWMLFRCGQVSQMLIMLRNMFTVYNPWILFNGAIEKTAGMNLKQWNILAMSIAAMTAVQIWREKLRTGGPGTQSPEEILCAQHVTLRFLICLMLILFVILFGTYGFGFSASSFIYGGF